MSWPHHIGETHQPDWVVYVRLCALVEDKCLNHFKTFWKKEVQTTLDRFFTSLAKRQGPATEEEKTYCTLNKLWKFGRRIVKTLCIYFQFNPLNPELNPICYLLALLGAHHFLHVSRTRVKLLTFRLLMSYIYIYIYIYIYGAPILHVSRSHTTTQHSR